MRSRSRSIVALTLFALASAGLMTGCAKSKTPQAEIRLPRTIGDESAWAAGAADATDQAALDAAAAEAAAGGVTPIEYPQGAWQPAGSAPSNDPLFNPADVTMGGANGFGTGRTGTESTAVVAATDSATGDFTNQIAADGVENGVFSAELEMIHFPFDSSEIAAEFTPVLEAHAAWLAQNPTIMVQVEGHCDERGTEEYNISLGQRRADTVRTFLIEKGVEATRMTTISYGKMRPLTFDQNEEANLLNRRAMFLVFEIDGAAQQTASLF